MDVAKVRGVGIAGNLVPGDSEQWDIDEHTHRYSAYFANPANDGWMSRQVMNDIMVCCL